LIVEAPRDQAMKIPCDDEISSRLNEQYTHDRKFKYPIKAIKSIALGNRFFAPEETQINGGVLKIELKEKDTVQRKSRILSFLVENNIIVYVVFQKGFTELKFEKCSITKKNSLEYELTLCD
jgi:hypothetical protein